MFDLLKSSLGYSIASGCAVVLLSVLGCGGGGGGGSAGGGADQPLAYVGNSNAASITASNANRLTFNVIDARGGGAATLVEGPLGVERQPKAALAQLLNWRFFEAHVRNHRMGSGRVVALAVPIDETILCDAGSVHLSGMLSDAGLGTVAVSFSECHIGNDALNGTATLRIDAFDLNLQTITDSTISFPRLALRSATDNVALGGSVRSQSSSGSETTTLNVVTLDNATGEMGKVDNFVVVDVPDAVLPSSVSETIGGRVFDSVHGFVDVVTLEPLQFTALQGSPNPGQLKLSGASGRSIRVTAVSTASVMLELDLDSDAAFESWTTVPWASISRTAVLDFTRPTAPVVSVSVNSDRSVTITWTPSTDSSGIREYRVRRGLTPIGRTTGTSLIDRSAEPGSTVDYYVRAVDNSGNVSDLMPPKSATIPSLASASFAPPLSFSAGGAGAGIAVADVNADGIRDLVVAGGQIATALGPLSGATSFTVSPIDFATMANDSNQASFLLADIAGSNTPEALGEGRTLVWNATNNAWEDSAGSTQSFQFEARAYIDLNDDGILDIVAPANGFTRLTGTLGTGNGSYDASSTRDLAAISWSRVGAIVAADIDRDGLTDLIVWDTDTIRVVRQTRRGVFAVVASLPAIDNAGFRAALLVADVTGDGYPEIIYAHYKDSVDQLRVYLNDGAGNFGSTAITSNVSAPWNFAAADFNGDGIPDLVVANRISNALDLYVSQGDGTFILSSSLAGVGFPFIVLADINLDGRIDIVTNDVRIYLGQ